MRRNTVVLYQLALDFTIHAPLSRLECSQIGEHELRAFLFIELVVILRNHFGAMACLVVGMVFVFGTYQTHIKSHFTGVIRGDEHFGLLLTFRQFLPTENSGISGLSELHQFLDELLLLRSGRYVVQYLVFLRSVHSHILRRAVIGNLIVEHS